MSSERIPAAPRGRGALANPASRFEPITVEYDAPGIGAPPGSASPTQYLRDPTRTLLSTNDSPDLPFDVSLNPYRGCEHGCAYCYARPTHEYLGFSAGLDFETRILVKEDAPRLLRRELASPRFRPQLLALSGVTDPYQPVERHLGLTRACLEVLADFRNPVVIVTKNHLVTRDRDHLESLARHQAAAVFVSITTQDGDLAARLEPRASHPRRRFQAIETLAAAGVPVGVLVAPVIPGLTEHEIPAVLSSAHDAGARFASFILLRLPHNLKTQFDLWLEEHYPQRRQKVMSRIRAVRGGRLNSTRFGERMRGQGVFAEQIQALFETTCRRLGIDAGRPRLSTRAFRRSPDQLALFD